MNPAIVVRGGGAAPYMISPTAAVPRAPGLGSFACCSRNNAMVDSNGAGLGLLESAGFWLGSGLSLPARADYDAREGGRF